jgi:hypothetical protein
MLTLSTAQVRKRVIMDEEVDRPVFAIGNKRSSKPSDPHEAMSPLTQVSMVCAARGVKEALEIVAAELNRNQQHDFLPSLRTALPPKG